MKKYPEIKWSEVVRKAIIEYLDRLRGSETLDSDYYANLARDTGVDLDSISIDQAEKHYEKMRKMEWERRSTTQTS